MNRFFDVDGDRSVQLAPWVLQKMGMPIKATFQLLEPLRFRSDVAGGVIVVPAHYCSDLASIPQFAWSIFMAPDDPRIELGAWVHDYLYGLRGRVPIYDETGQMRCIIKMTRRECDHILAHEAMADLGATPLQRTAVYQSLRRFGDLWPGESRWEGLFGG